MVGVILCLGFCWARAAVEQNVRVLLLDLSPGWAGLWLLHGFVYVLPMCWAWVGP